MRLIERLGAGRDAAIVEVGGGASILVDDLVVRRFSDVTAVGHSAAPLGAARARLAAVDGVRWVEQDLLTWRPAADGPDSCSGLPVQRYTVDQLGFLLGDGFTPVVSTREEHVTPAGATQPFTWLAAQRTGS